MSSPSSGDFSVSRKEQRSPENYRPSSSAVKNATDEAIDLALQNAREKLLDLSLRNKLLNFKETKKVIRVCDEMPDEIYKLLVQDQIAMEFLPDPTKDADTFEPVLAEATSEDGEIEEDEEDDFLLPAASVDRTNLESKYTDQYLQTSLGEKQLQTRLLHIYYDASTVIQETGTNMLYLAIGFLQWTEDKFNKKTSALAPLILIPVKLERGTVKTRFSLTWNSEDIDTNESLAVKLRELGVELPRIGDSEELKPEEYFELVNKAIADKKDWKIRREMVLGFFHFGKLRMYLDLDPALWGGSAFFERHQVLGQMFGRASENHNEVEMLPEDQAFDPEVAPLVVDADSSQHSVILDSMTGKNLVIEGPPGTGKSQTISNLIAGFLKKGKTVLFVAEKAAALDVVKDRLKDVGLGDFCLELHSHKANKQSVLQSIKLRLERSKGVSPDWTSRYSQLRSFRKQLSDYAAKINQVIGTSGLSINQAIGIRSNALIEHPDLHLKVSRVVDASSMSKEEYEDKKRLLEVTCNSLANLSPISSQPLYGIEAKTLLPGDEKVFFDNLTTFINKLEELNNEIAKLTWLDHSNSTIGFVKSISELKSEIATIPKNYPSDLFSFLFKHESQSIVSEGTEISTRLVKAQKEVSPFINIEELPNSVEELVASIKFIDSSVGGINWQNWKNVFLNLEDLRQVTQSLAQCIPSYWSKKLTGSETYGKRLVEQFLQVAEASKLLPSNLDGLIVSAFSDEKIWSQLEQVIEEKNKYDLLLSDIRDTLHVEELDDDYTDFAKDLENLSSDLLVTLKLGILKGEYRRALAKIKLLRRNSNSTIDLLEWSRHLRKFSRLQEMKNKIDSNSLMLQLLGSAYKGIDSRWDHFEIALQWQKRVRHELELPKEIISELTSERLFNLVELTQALQQNLLELNHHLEALLEKQEVLTGTKLKLGECFEKESESLQELIDSSTSTWNELSKFCKSSLEGTLPDWKALLLKASEFKYESDLFKNSSKYSVLKDYFRGTETDWRLLKEAQAWTSELNLLPKPLVEHIDCEMFLDRWSQFESWCKVTAATIQKVETALADVKNTMPLNEQKMFPFGFYETAINELILRSNLITSSTTQLSEWTQLNQRLEAVRQSGIFEFVEGALEDPSKLSTALASYELAYAESILREAHINDPQLGSFRKLDHEATRESFQKLDQEVIQQSRRIIAHHAANRNLPMGEYGSRVSDLTEGRLLQHEIGKEKRHRPLRELVQRAGKAMLALKPVFMMSPMSVAQYLRPLEIQFDVLIMDEASQIKPENAFGAIARAKQIIVVGDTKQLPPTDFFETEKYKEETDETSTFEQLESILEYSSKVFPSKMLKWHYRSKHESLIAFSNAEFYDYSLKFVPSPIDNDQYGINWHHVNGVYDRGKSRKNRIEARAVANAIIEHATKYPNLSLGIGTLNRPQAEAIEEELEILRTDNPQCEAYFSNKSFSKNSEEPFFIKNLENLQGDERDVIMISVGFGRDSDGVFYQNFGPLQYDGGWRRLNVLVTRARQKIELFSSITADDIKLSPGRKMGGTAALKRYLAFAETGILDQPHDSGRETDSPFEDAVIKVLNLAGYKTTPQLGVRGFYIDIAVHHPEREGKYILAVECDGATYHSLRSTRDRDRLREAALVNQGWNVYRIWSTSWFNDFEGERKRLIEAVEKAWTGQLAAGKVCN